MQNMTKIRICQVKSSDFMYKMSRFRLNCVQIRYKKSKANLEILVLHRSIFQVLFVIEQQLIENDYEALFHGCISNLNRVCYRYKAVLDFPRSLYDWNVHCSRLSPSIFNSHRPHWSLRPTVGLTCVATHARNYRWQKNESKGKFAKSFIRHLQTSLDVDLPSVPCTTNTEQEHRLQRG